jgi:pimeloyl-ACP methyl ester carboxylesterase
MARGIALVAAMALVGGLASCSSGSDSGSGSDTGSGTEPPVSTVAGGIQWGSCVENYPHQYSCGRLEVPLDPAQPTGEKITLALIRTKAAGTKTGSLLVNPGGPGASALDSWDGLSRQISASVHKHFDVIGFDPRGVGQSTAVHCGNAAALDAYTSLDFDPRTSAERQALLDGAKAFAAGCVAGSGSLLRYVGTAYAAADLDAIRQAVGDDKLSYLGFSYGTFLGSAYAQQFPTHIRAMVLDGALDASEPATQITIEQSAAFQRQLDRFLANCASSKSCAWKFNGDPHGALRALVAKVDANPIRVGNRTFTAGLLFFGMGYALYDEASWPTLAQALQGVATGKPGLMLQLADLYNGRAPNGEYTNETDANLAINCRDYEVPATVDAAFAAAAQAAAVAPDFGAANMNLALPCVFFPKADQGADIAPFTAVGAPPVVVVATTGDPATPYSQGVSLATSLSSGVLLTDVGERHTAYGYSPCVTKLVDAYLTDLSVPASGTRCDG